MHQMVWAALLNEYGYGIGIIHIGIHPSQPRFVQPVLARIEIIPVIIFSQNHSIFADIRNIFLFGYGNQGRAPLIFQ